MHYSNGLFIYRQEETLRRLTERAELGTDHRNYLEYFKLHRSLLKARPAVLEACKPVREIYHYAVCPDRGAVPEEDRGHYLIADYVGLSVSEAKIHSAKVIAHIAELTGKRWYLSRVMTREPLDLVAVFYAAEGSGAPVIREVKPLAYAGCTKAESWELEVLGL